MRLGLGIFAVLLALALPAYGQPMPQTDAEFVEALHGCWKRASWPAEIEAQRADPNFFVSGQMCLDSATGAMDFFSCTGGMDCWETVAKYEIRDSKFWRDHGDNTSGGRMDKCEMALEGGRWLKLSNCQWVDADAGVEPIENILYERIIDL